MDSAPGFGELEEVYIGHYKGNETGLGWDPVKKTIDGTDEWWEKELQNAGLAHISKLDIMFRGITATGEGAWALSFGLNFEDAVRFDQDNDVMLDVEETDDSDDEPGDIHADLDTQTKESKRATPTIQDRKRKKGIQIFDQHFTRLCDVLEKRVTTSFSNKPGRSIDEVMAVVRKLAEIENDYEVFRDANMENNGYDTEEYTGDVNNGEEEEKRMILTL
ncbi:uncharacterized protein LOC122274392 [Carya illinoinensis]|uniref:uncharacterized protein LOC122274392 n=1 Tax=Carya illinoinensis TaxID=32201 RepID=UPI001C721619|nr:uncharacterized protein LOC122274392 [Carya illinoinensis]